MSTLVAVYAMFVVGYVLHAALQIDAVVRAKNNAAYSRWAVIKDNGIALAARFFVSFIAFAVIRNHPEYISKLLSLAGIQLGSGLSDIGNSSGNWIFAGMFGFMVDTLLAFVPFLKNTIPQINGLNPPPPTPPVQ